MKQQGGQCSWSQVCEEKQAEDEARLGRTMGRTLAFIQSDVASQSGLFLKFICLFVCLFIRERGREGEREGENYQCVRDTLIGCLLPAPAGDLAHNPGMRPDLESNWHLLVRRPVLSPLSHSSRGSQWSFHAGWLGRLPRCDRA